MILALSGFLLLLLAYTIYALTRPNRLYADAQRAASEMSLTQLRHEYANLGWSLNIFFVGGALLTGVFAVQFFSGTDNFMHMHDEQWVYAGIGIVATLGITLAQRQLYSSIHQNNAALLITALILTFVIFSELATSTERTDMLAKHRSKESPVYQAVIKRIENDASTNQTVSPALIDAKRELADAELELGRCERHQSSGQARVERCQVFERKRIAAAQATIDAINTQTQAASHAEGQQQQQLVGLAKELQNDESQQPAIVRFLKALFGAEDILYAMILASLIFVIAFESGFHFAGTRRAVIQHAIMLASGAVKPAQHRPAPAADKPSEPHPNAGTGAFGSAFAPARHAPEPLMDRIKNTASDELLKAQAARDNIHAMLRGEKAVSPLGAQEQQLPLPDFSAFKASGGGWASPTPEPSEPHPNAGSKPQSAEEKLADPSNFDLLKRYVAHKQFDTAFIGVATGATGCSQKQLMKQHGIGGDLPSWIMVILEAWGIVSDPNPNKGNQRELVKKLKATEAEAALVEVKTAILGNK